MNEGGAVARLASSLLYSEAFGIGLQGGEEGEIFKGFLASLLFGARISEKIAEKTCRTLERHRLLTPESIIEAGRDFLVDPVMREGGASATTARLPISCRMIAGCFCETMVTA